MHDVYEELIQPELIEPHYSTRIYKGFLIYLMKKFGLTRAKEIVQKSGLSWSYLISDVNWVSETFADRFYDVLTCEPDIDPDFAYRASKIAMSKEVQGVIVLLVFQFIDPAKLFKQIIFLVNKMNHVDKVELRLLKHNRMELYFESRRVSKHFITILEGWRGNLEAGPAAIGHPPGVCTYQVLSPRSALFSVKWKTSSLLYYLVRVQVLAVIVLVILTLGAGTSLVIPQLINFDNFPIIKIILFTLLTLLLSLLGANRIKNRFFVARLNDVESLLKESEDQHQILVKDKMQLDRRYKEANLLRMVIERIGFSQDSQEMIKKTLQEMRETLGYDRIIYFAHNEINKKLYINATEGFTEECNHIFRKYELDLNEITDSDYHLGNVFKKQKNIFVPINHHYVNSLSSSARQIVELADSRSFLACVVRSNKYAHGVLLVDYYQSEKVLSVDDLHIVENLSNQLAIYLDNVKTLEQERQMRKQFQKFVPPTVIDSIMGDTNSKYTTGILREVTVLMSDIRGFTQKTSLVDPNRLVAALNLYFREMATIVYKHGGIIDKFMGDAVLAVFNSFGDLSEHALCATRAAADMQEAMVRVRQMLQNEVDTEGVWGNLEIGIGIDVGAVVVGTIGSDNKSEFTAIGEAVNIAARLCEIAKRYHSSIVVSQAVLDKISNDFQASMIGDFSIRGLDRSINLYLIERCDEKYSMPKVKGVA